MDREQSLSEHFLLKALLVDESFPEMADELVPDEATLGNLKRLAAVLEMVCTEFDGGWTVRSGYRDEALNEACREKGLPASVDSLHLLGCAADLAPDGDQDLEAVFDWLSDQGREGTHIQEAVYYPKKGFIHIGVPHADVKQPRRFIMRV